jgi:type II secretory pathway pseudopilin PulG
MNNTEGFSLLECAIVIALLIIITSIIITHGTYLQRILVRQDLERLVVVCRFLQQTAMINNVSKELIFDRKNKSYTYDSITEKLSRTTEFGVLPGTLGPPSDPSRPEVQPITFSNEKIIFHPDGIIQPGTVYLISKDMHIMYALTCAVGQVSFLRIYRYDGKWHCIS